MFLDVFRYNKFKKGTCNIRLGVVRFAFGVFQIFIIVQNLPNNESYQ